MKVRLGMREKFLKVFLWTAFICCLLNNQVFSQEEKTKGFDVHSWVAEAVIWSKVHQDNYKFVFTKITEGITYKNYLTYLEGRLTTNLPCQKFKVAFFKQIKVKYK